MKYILKISYNFDILNLVLFNGAKTFIIMTFNITTLIIMTLSINGLFETFSIMTNRNSETLKLCYAEFPPC
jgi:hypothetical protein